ncbi:type II toxin-antitoxin system VapC family toxin [Mucisphaera calidilacus]|uniref:Ribonuclease VapC n=1 Tax=Mucisphaera calidilacus TaxID=2527982 RepID=A0A518BTH7_9BACT|nr:type II toxin-antitoxin system VapC family toxin [Mucisphaera calidilacus]QDU70281.1 tRNA(fMet)-specific endonuclease VapC [Mucisphaera calidilacus]
MKPITVLLEASAALAWLLDDSDRGPYYHAFFAVHDLVVIPLWHTEVLNVLLKRERQKKLSRVKADELIEMVVALDPFTLPEPDSRTLAELASLARPHQLSAYDTLYLEAAINHQLPLATEDKNLRHAARSVGVEVCAV